jgi:uncharacterized protein YukE
VGLEPDGGASGPTWNGVISVTPDNLAAAAPGVAGASDEIGAAAETVATWSDGTIVGITDPRAAQAWGRMCNAWTVDLGNLSYSVYEVSTKLPQTAQSYNDSDAGAAGNFGPH